MNIKNLNSKRVLKAFQKMGMYIDRQSGTHVVIKGVLHGKLKTFVIPIHYKEIAEGTMNDILKHQAEISREDFFKYY